MHRLRVDKTGVYVDGQQLAATQLVIHADARADGPLAWAHITLPVELDVDLDADVKVIRDQEVPVRGGT